MIVNREGGHAMACPPFFVLAGHTSRPAYTYIYIRYTRVRDFCAPRSSIILDDGGHHPR